MAKREAMRKSAFILMVGLGLSGCLSQPGALVDDTKNRVVDIVNTTATPLEFYAMSAERSRVFRSRKAEQQVAANYYVTVNFDEGNGACFYNLFVTTASGARAEAGRFDVCREVAWVVTSDMLQ